jgi:hypothetical protein
MNPTRKRILFAVATTGLLSTLLGGTALAAPSDTPFGTRDVASVRSYYCVGIPYIHYGSTTIYPGGEACIPGP